MTRIAIVLILDEADRYFVHRRRPDKRVYPELWGLGAGGRIHSGESNAAGASRELFEETSLRPERMISVGQLRFEDPSNSVHHTISLWVIRTAERIANHDEEWSTSKFVDASEVEAMIERGELCPDSAECFRRFQRVGGVEALKANRDPS